MTVATRAVFLSYASQDEEAATRICDALRAAGVEVWLDKSQLRGGDDWDAQIKKQIHDCALFLPLISAHTDARIEGYFRREWNLAKRRLLDRAEDSAFLVPVVIDETREADARVPEEFLHVQWSRLPGGETPPAFAQRVRQLLGAESAPVRAAPSSEIPKIEPGVRVGHARNRRAPSLRVVVPALIALLVLGAGVFWYIKGASYVPAAKEASTTTSPVPSAAPNEKSIAVLPFVNMSPDKDQDYFADGIAEELLNLLAQVPQLRVIARTSSFSFKGKQVDITEIARRLNVAQVLEGSVRKSGDTLRVTVQLVRTADSSHLWSHTYDRQMTDVFKVQDEISAAVVSELKIKLLTATPKAKTTDPKAYALYLQAPKPNTYIKDVEQAVALYKQVLAIDPSYAPAWDGLADAYYSQMNDGVRTSAQALPLAREAVNQALTNDPGYAPAYARAATIESAVVGRLGAAAQYLEKGLALDPYNLDLIDAAVKITRRLGRLDQSLALAEYAAGRDPVSVPAHESLAWAYMLTGRLDEALTEFRTALSLRPDADALHESLGEILLQKGDALAALAEMQQEPFELLRLVGLSMAYQALGQKAKSDSALDDLIRKGEKTMPYYISYALAFRGETNRAFQWLEKAIEYGDSYISWASIDPNFKILHKDPRWMPLLRRIGQAPEQLAAINLNVSVPK